MSFSLFFQSLINGLNQGAIYALIALGYTMVYGIIRMINFAHGDFIMIGAYTLFYTIPLMVNAGMPAWLAVIVAIAVCAVVGVLVETFAYRPVRKAGPMSALITALAMSIFLENLAMVLFGAKPHNVQAIFSLPTITVGSVALPLNVLLTIAIGLGIMIALQLFVKKTKLGKAMRAVPQDKDAAQHRAGDDADAAEDGCDEGLHAHHRAHVVRDAGIGGAVHQRRHRRQPRTDGEGRGDNFVDIDAYQS